MSEKIADAVDHVLHPNAAADQDVESNQDSSDESSEENVQDEGQAASQEHDPRAILKHPKFDKFKKGNLTDDK